MSLNDLQSEFSLAYVGAVVHAAGFFTNPAGRMLDNDGLDLEVFSRASNGPIRSPRLGLQVKSTSEPVLKDPFPHDLETKNYDELRDDGWQVPRILVVVVVPPNMQDWVSSAEDALTLRHCGYWTSLRGAPPTENAYQQRVHIARSSRFDVESLKAIMNRIQERGLP